MKLSNNGFTLIELVIVLSLVGLIAMLSFSNMSFFQRVTHRTELHKLVSVCRYLQQVAMTTGREQYLILHENRNTYSYNKHTERLPHSLVFGFLSPTKGPPAYPRKQITQAITFHSNQIVFYPTGIISAGTIYFLDESQRMMYALSNAVSNVSYFRLYSYDTKWHMVS